MKKLLAVSLLLLATGCSPYLRNQHDNRNDNRRDDSRDERYDKKDSKKSDRKDRDEKKRRPS